MNVTSFPTFNQIQLLHELHSMLGDTHPEPPYAETRMLGYQRYSSVTASNYTAALHEYKPQQAHEAYHPNDPNGSGTRTSR